MSKVLNVFLLVLVAVAASVGAQTASTVLNGLVYTFPTGDGAAGTVLLNDGAGGLSWIPASAGGGATMPQYMIVYSTGGCPSGFTTYTSMQGRYAVGATANIEWTVGTALSNGENRATGNHTDHSISGYVNLSNGNHGHTVNDPGHSHGSDSGAIGLGRAPDYVQVGWDPEEWAWEPGAAGRTGSSRQSGSSGTGVTFSGASISASGSASFSVANGGTGTGTNAPYIQLTPCYKQ